MRTSQAPARKTPTTIELQRRRFELMAREHVIRMGERIRDRREERGLTQRELAELIPGKSDGNQVSKWERGEHRVSDDTLEHIARALEVDPSYFLVPAPADTEPADLMEALKGAEPSQLDRIETMLAELLRRTEPTPGSVIADAADRKPARQPRKRAANPPDPQRQAQ